MQKKIAVLVRDRQDEALRMAAGLILADDQLGLFVMDRKLEPTEGNTMNVELLKDMDQKVYSNTAENADMEQADNARIAELLTGYDHILPY